MITPETSNQNEYVPFSLTYVISAAAADPMAPPETPPPVDPILQSVNITSSDGVNYADEMTITINSPQSFTIAGALSDVFNRVLNYLDKNDVQGTCGRFKDIPKDFNTLYHYTGATVNSITLSVHAITDQGVETSTIIVQNNYNVANAKLHEYVALGKY